ncbi:hypothetical protein SAMN04515674_10975 [Pseudarcicella hirudinis]|uniref:Lipoprotein n=1 Tax=Pseudarcicella hirudinis TaxID=1079859 RepID=A0A1I5VG83_9BACT|nr:hypothetical protein [Pseudarcicella hirudinis]SFQ05996.1 hypothetical protein SAMN04515674_10975 [Pseudarcicella hirudinis]
MKKLIAALFLISILASCQSKTNQYQTGTYLSDADRDSLLTNIITFIYLKAPYANNKNRFEPQFRSFYVKNLPSFYLENYYPAPDGTNYFFVIRPVGNGLKYRRGVLGKFKLKQGSLMPEEFEEIVNTPHLEEEVLRERGRYLFQELVKNGNLDKELSMKHYVEWPDSSLVYDRKINEWVSTRKY